MSPPPTGPRLSGVLASAQTREDQQPSGQQGPPRRTTRWRDLMAHGASSHEQDDHTLHLAYVTIKSIFAGGIAGMVAKTVVAPVDRIKIMFQVSTEKFAWRKIPEKMRDIIKNEGVRGLWKGNSATMLRVFPYAGIQFMTFDAAKLYILKLKRHESDGHLSNLESLLAGSFAGFVSVTCTYPLDLARARLAVERAQGIGPNHNVLYVFRTAYKQGGASNLYRGITPTLLGILPYAGIAFMINERCVNTILKLADRSPTTLERLASGALSGLIAQSATYPLDLCRRRMQTAGWIVSLYGHKGMVSTSAGMGDILRQIYVNEGYRGFFKGLSMNWIKGPVALSISFTTFDFLKKYFHVTKRSRN